MYNTHTALRDMASLLNDHVAVVYHTDKMTQIHSGFQRLWITERGHPAVYKEEIGHERLRPDAWLYSVCVPIEAGLMTQEQQAQALYYTEWGLQRDVVTCGSDVHNTHTHTHNGAHNNNTHKDAHKDKHNDTHNSNTHKDTHDNTYKTTHKFTQNNTCGVRVWTSNWVPSIWSVREFWPGDNHMLALSYFKAGLPDDGWEVLFGNVYHDMYNYISPGLLGAHNGVSTHKSTHK